MTESQGLPKFRKFGGHTAYIEGWGLYCELIPKEMGFYQDPYSDFGRLAMDMNGNVFLPLNQRQVGRPARRSARREFCKKTVRSRRGSTAVGRQDFSGNRVEDRARSADATGLKSGVAFLDGRAASRRAFCLNILSESLRG